MKAKQLKKLKLQEEKLAQFEQEYDHYEEKDMGGEIWVKNWNGSTKRWQVSVYSPASFKRYKGFTNEFKEQNNHFFNI